MYIDKSIVDQPTTEIMTEIVRHCDFKYEIVLCEIDNQTERVVKIAISAISDGKM